MLARLDQASSVHREGAWFSPWTPSVSPSLLHRSLPRAKLLSPFGSIQPYQWVPWHLTTNSLHPDLLFHSNCYSQYFVSAHTTQRKNAVNSDLSPLLWHFYLIDPQKQCRSYETSFLKPTLSASLKQPLWLHSNNTTHEFQWFMYTFTDCSNNTKN